MAISPIAKYPTRVEPATTEYPYGKAKNRTAPNNGTPWNDEDIVNDIFGLLQAIDTEAGITPSGTPDNAVTSQRLQALKQLFGARVANYAAARALDSSTLTDGQLVWIDGYSFMVKTGTVTDDDSTLIVFTDDSNRYLELIVSGSIDIQRFGASLDYVYDETDPSDPGAATDDTAAVIAAINSGAQSISIPKGMYLSPSTANTATILKNLNKLQFLAICLIKLPDSNGTDISINERILLTNPTLMNLMIYGANVTSTTASAISQTGGAAKAYSVEYTLSDASVVDVGDYMFVTASAGTGDYKASEGCFKVTAKAGSVVTVNHPLNATWPTMTLSSATIWPVKTILRWTANTLGVGIAGTHLRALSGVVLAGQFDISTDTPADGAVDGLQIGTANNFPVTGLNESERMIAGSLWSGRIGIVEWENNGVQIVAGRFYSPLASSCGNGWRGFQSSDTGAAMVKFSSAIGNGASGYQQEQGGSMLANNSVSAGNWQQGYYGIGGGDLGVNSAFAISNGSNGLDARNGSSTSADGLTITGSTTYGIYCVNANVTFGSSATVSGSGTADVRIEEGGKVNGNGASSLGTVSVDYDSGSILINTAGDKLPVERWDAFPTAPAFASVTVTTDNSSGSYCQIGNICHWKIRMNYSGLDTADVSEIQVTNLPIAMGSSANRVGMCSINIKSSTGLTFAATDTYQATYNTIVDGINIIDASGAIPLYNSGKIAASGIVDLAGWYEVP